MKTTRDLVVIGGGPGGYPAAFLAADMGLDVVLIDTEPHPGGVCLHRGCIPSKTLLHAAATVTALREAPVFGLSCHDMALDVDRLREWKDSVVSALTGGLGQLVQRRGITYVQGRARFSDAHTVNVERHDGRLEMLAFKTAILATGSSPARLPVASDSPRIIDSTVALELGDVPKRLVVIGGGYIGIELGQAYAAFGASVTVVEMLPALLAGVDADLTQVLEKRLQCQFERILTATRVAAVTAEDATVAIVVEANDGKPETLVADRVLIAVGRQPNTRDLGLEQTGVKMDSRGFIETDRQQRTHEPSIFAIGDIAGQPMLAHKATYESRVAVEAILGKKTEYDPRAIPAVVFTDPEIAWTGVTESEARTRGLSVQIARYPWTASGRAMTLGRSDGLTKLLCERDTGRLLGAGIVGPGAGELIAEATLAIEMGATAEDVAWTIHAHPTLSETIMEAAEVATGQATHVAKR